MAELEHETVEIVTLDGVQYQVIYNLYTNEDRDECERCGEVADMTWRSVVDATNLDGSEIEDDALYERVVALVDDEDKPVFCNYDCTNPKAREAREREIDLFNQDQ